MPWQGYDIYAMNRVWSVPKTGKYAEYIARNFIPGYQDIAGIHDRLDALDNAGLIHHPQKGRWPGLKRYADADTGNPAQNLFLYPAGFTNFSTKGGEYTGWKTQKPVALLQQIIKASSNPRRPGAGTPSAAAPPPASPPNSWAAPGLALTSCPKPPPY